MPTHWLWLGQGILFSDRAKGKIRFWQVLAELLQRHKTVLTGRSTSKAGLHEMYLPWTFA